MSDGKVQLLWYQENLFNNYNLVQPTFCGGNDFIANTEPNVPCPLTGNTPSFCAASYDDDTYDCNPEIQGVSVYRANGGPAFGDNPGCSPGDWAFCNTDWPGNAAPAIACTEPDPGQCPFISSSITPNNTTFSSSGDTTNNFAFCFTQSVEKLTPCSDTGNFDPVPGPAAMTCEYNTDQFTFEDSQTWLNLVNDTSFPSGFGFGGSDGQACDQNNIQQSVIDGYNEIMAYVCSLTASDVNMTADCPPPNTVFLNEITNVPESLSSVIKDDVNFDNCSVISMQNDYGDACRAWCNDPVNATACSAIVNNYCCGGNCNAGSGVDASTNYDCLCAARAFDPVYQKLKRNAFAGTSLADVCWYTPCVVAAESGNNGNPFLINQATLSETCPSDIELCQQLTVIKDNTGIGITSTGNERVQNCNFGDNPPSAGIQQSTLIIIIIIAAIVGLAAIIFVVILISVLTKKKGKSSSSYVTGTTTKNAKQYDKSQYKITT